MVNRVEVRQKQNDQAECSPEEVRVSTSLHCIDDFIAPLQTMRGSVTASQLWI